MIRRNRAYNDGMVPKSRRFRGRCFVRVAGERGWEAVQEESVATKQQLLEDEEGDRS